MDKDIKDNKYTTLSFIDQDEAILYQNKSVEVKREFNNEEVLGNGILVITSK